MSRRENMPYEGQSLQGIFQNFSAYFQDDPSGPQTVRVLCKKELDTSTTSINSYVNYRKKVNNNLAKINSNISEMLMESFKGIDSICSKVRDCISEFQPPDPQKCAENHLPEISMQKPTYTESFADDARTQMLRRRERDQTFKEIGIKPDLTVKLNTAKDKTERPISQTDCKQKDNLDISKPKYQEMSTSYLEDRSSQYDEASIYEEKIKETSQINDANPEHHDSDGSSCLIESVASEDKIKVDDTCIDEEIRPDEDNKTVTDINTQEEDEEEEEENESKQLCNPADIGEGGKAEDISEITEISVTSEALYPEKRVKKSKIDRKRRHRQRKVLKEYRDALRNEVDNTDFNSLQQIIQNLTERIDILSNASKEVPAEETSLRGSQRELIKQSIRQAKREARRKTNRHRKSENEDYDYNDITKDDGNILKGPKSITSFLGTILTSALEKKLNDDAQGKPKHNLTEVYHRPAITNLHKRLIAQLEANDSFLCLQKLLGKQKKDKDVNKSVFSRINIPLLNIPQPNVKAEKLKMIKTDKMDMLEDPPSQKSNLRSKYADSLWFGERKMFKLNKNSSQTNLDPRKRKKLKERTRLGESGKISSIQIKPMTNYSSTNPNATDNKCGAVYRCGVTVSNENRDNIQSTTVKTRVHWMRQRNDGQGPLRKLEYLDILDDLTHKDLLPLRSEYPRKDQELDEAFGVDQSKTIQDTYLWKMMYGKEKNDTVWTHLIQPNVECVDRECNICTRPSKEKWQSVDDRLSPRIKPSMSRSKSVIFEGSVRSSLSMLNQQKSKSKRKVIEKLAPYLFDPKEERNNQTLIVMPVRVFYDNYNNPTNISGLLNKNNADPPTVISKASKKPTVPKLPLAVKAALKEAKANKSGKKSPPLVKPKRVICSFQGKEGKEGESIRAIRFNSARVERLINEPEKEQGFKKESKSMTQKDFSNFNSSTSESKPTELNDPQQLAYKKAIMRNLNRMVKIHEPKDDLQRALIKSSPKSPNKKLHDKLTYLRGTNPVTLTQNIEKQDQKSEAERKNINKFSIFNSSGNRKPTSLEMKAAVEKRIAELKPAIEKREAEKFEFTDQKSDRERKLLSFKYGKSIGDQLVSFLNNQPASPDLLIPPLNIHQMNMPRYTPSLGRYTNQNANMGGLPKIDSDRSSSSPVKTAAPSPTKTALSSPVKTVNANPRHRQVLMHLRGLKQKNNQIQSNIQKAIEVIETKMVDILSCPGDNTNVEAFDVMEKEITNVLDLMKFTSPSGNRKGGKQLLEHEFETISKELFSKLERILDSEQSVDHTSASETEKESPRSKIKEKTLSNIISTSKLQQSSSATTISHENIHQPRRSSKQRSKSPLHKVKSDTLTNLQPAEMSLSNAEKYIVGEHTTFNEHTANGHVFDKKEDIEKNHGDQLDIEEEPVTRDTENECESLEAKKIEQEELDVILDTEAQLARLEKLLRGDLSNGEDEISIAKDTLTEALEHEKENERFLLQIESSIRTEPNALSNIEEIDSQEHISYGDEIKSEQESFPNMGNLTPSIWAISQGARVQEYNLQVIPSKEKVEDGDVPSTPRTGGLSATTSNEHISERLSEQLSEQKSDQEFSEPEQQISEPEQHFSEPEQQFSEPEPLELEPVSKLKIFTEVPSGDDQISSGAEEYMTPQHTSQEVSPRENNLESLEEVQNRLLPASEGSNSNLNDQVDQIIQRVEDIYAHLDDIQEGKEVPVFREGHKPFKIPSKEFLTPFMQAVKDKRTNNPDGTNTLEGTASYYNILHFLDTLNELQIEKAQEVHTARLYKYARVCNIPNVVHQATIEYPIHSKISEKPSCLKKCDDSKNKNKKVSFLVLKENKEAQVTMCPYHNKVKCIKVSTGQHSPDEDEFHTEGTTLISRKRPETIPEEPSDVSRSEKLEKPKELPKPKEAPNYVNKEVQNVDESKNIQVDSFESSEFTGDSSEPTETEDSYITATNTPKVEVNYNTSEESIPQIIHKKNQISGYYGTRSILHIRNRSNVRSKIKPNLVIFKKVNMSDLLKRPKDIERFSDMQMKPAAKNTFTNFKQDNVGFLKSFYAIMYILVFTALNMEYKCY